MFTDFSKLDKSDFKSLKTPDGSFYYGQVVQILPPSVQTDKLTGFKDRAKAAEESRAATGIVHDRSTASLAPPGTSGTSMPGTALSI